MAIFTILILSSDDSITRLADQLRDKFPKNNVEVIRDFNQAKSYIQNTPPAVILIQASWNDSPKFCDWFKQQPQFFWIYRILVDDSPQLLSLTSQDGKEWELEKASAVLAAQQLMALQQGVNTYIWLPPKKKNISDQIEETAEKRLLVELVNRGLSQAQNYQDLIRTIDLCSAIALTDVLTGVKNRRALEQDLPHHIQQALSTQKPLSLIMLEVDQFKKVNDTYGHPVGDRILQLLCEHLQSNLREQDSLYRYGGDEFVIIASNTTDIEALALAECLNRTVREQNFLIDEQWSINVKISLGTACLLPKDDAKGESLRKRADKCVLKAKDAGGDRVIGDCVVPVRACTIP